MEKRGETKRVIFSYQAYESRRQSRMKVRKVLGGFAWAMLAAMLILVNAMAADGDELFDRTENSNVSAVIQYQR